MSLFVSLATMQNRWFVGLMVNIKFGLDSNQDESRRIVEDVIQLAEKSTVCIGQANLFEIDYAFACQVITDDNFMFMDISFSNGQ